MLVLRTDAMLFSPVGCSLFGALPLIRYTVSFCLMFSVGVQIFLKFAAPVG